MFLIILMTSHLSTVVLNLNHLDSPPSHHHNNKNKASLGSALSMSKSLLEVLPFHCADFWPPSYEKEQSNQQVHWCSCSETNITRDLWPAAAGPLVLPASLGPASAFMKCHEFPSLKRTPTALSGQCWLVTARTGLPTNLTHVICIMGS